MYYDAIENVIANKDPQAEWEDDQMRAALLEVAKGGKQEEAVADRDIPQGTLSRVYDRVQDEYDRLAIEHESDAGLFRDPVEEVIEQFEQFFQGLNDEFDMGINDTTVRMMVKEIENMEQLPAPLYLERFLNQSASGVSRDSEINWIKRQYTQWLDKVRQELPDAQGMVQSGGMGGGFGQQIGGNQYGAQDQNIGPGIGGSNQPNLHGPQQGQPPQQQGRPPGQDDRIDRLERKIESLIEREQNGQQQEQYSEHTIKIRMDDGKEVEVPPDHPMARDLLDNDDGGDDFIETMAKMQEIGVIPDPNQQEPGDQMAEQISAAIQQLGQQQMQVQEQISENFQTVLDQVQEAQQDDDGPLTAEEVQEMLEEELREDERTRLEKKMEKMQDEFNRRLQSDRREKIGEKDPEYLKKDREFQFREKQMEQINDQLQELPEKMAIGVRQGLVPAIREITNMSGGAAERMWSPPTEGQRGAPEYAPGGKPPSEEDVRAREREESRTQRARQQAGEGRRRGQQEAERAGAGGQSPEDPGRGAGHEQNGADAGEMGQRGAGRATADQATDVRKKLNLED